MVKRPQNTPSKISTLDFKEEFDRSESFLLSPTIEIDWSIYGILHARGMVDLALKKYRQRHHKRVQTVSPGLAIGGHAVSRGDRAERFQTD